MNALYENDPRRLILASGSPRRHELLTAAGIPHLVRPGAADETLPDGIAPADAVELLSRRKADAALAALGEGEILLAADTVVALDGAILGKPRDAADAARMLRALSGRTHSVFTGVTVADRTRAVTAHEETVVRFRALGEAEIAAYVESGEPLDKAGAYGIQGAAALFVQGIRGDYANVVGLPLCLCGTLLREHFGFPRPADR